MVVALDYGACDSVLNWASEIIEAHPYHNVIVTTHALIHRSGEFLNQSNSSVPSAIFNPSNTFCGYNNPDVMWDKFISQHENIVLALCGHVHSDNVIMIERNGVNGNKVVQLLIDAQSLDLQLGGLGFLATLYVSKTGENITLEWYSTVTKKYFKAPQNNFTFNINVIREP